MFKKHFALIIFLSIVVRNLLAYYYRADFGQTGSQGSFLRLFALSSGPLAHAAKQVNDRLGYYWKNKHENFCLFGKVGIMY